MSDHPTRADGPAHASRDETPTTVVTDAPVEPDTSTPPPRVIGSYELREPLGAGGMGTVYVAWDPRLDRPVAIKLIRARGSAPTGAEQGRMLREALALAALSHPNVVNVFEAGWHERTFFIAMEFIRGQTLRQWVRGRPRDWAEIVDMYVRAGRGLAHAHRHGIVHRDFKPANVVVGDDGRPRVVDFGLAKAADYSESMSTAHPVDTGSSTLLGTPLTTLGTVMGTPAYIAPEQVYGAGADERSDQFCFCVALWEALYGQLPFVGKTMEAQFESKRAGRLVPAPRSTRVPARIERVLRRGLEGEPSRRYPSMEALLADLEPDRSARWARYVLPVGAGLGLLVVAHTAPQTGPQCQQGATRIERVLDTSRRAALERALLGSDRPHAADTWVRTEAALDQYSEQWSAAHRAACRQHEVQEIDAAGFDRSLSCLRRRLADYEAVVEVLEGQGSAVLDRAVRLARGLPAVDECRLETTQESTASAWDPEGEQLYRRLARVEALWRAGRYADAHTEARACMQSAESLPPGPIVVLARYTWALAQSGVGEFESARQSYEQAYWEATEQGDDRLASAAAMELAHLVGSLLARPDEGLHWARQAEAMLDRQGRPSVPIAALLGTRGTLHGEQGHYEEAEALLRQALRMALRDGGPDDLAALGYRSDLGIILAMRGDLEGARDVFEQVYESTVRTLGRAHPDVARAQGYLAQALASLGDDQRALELYGDQLRHIETSLGPEHPRVHTCLTNLASHEVELGLLESGQDHAQRALAGIEAALGPEHPSLAQPLVALGNVHLKRGDAEAALVVFRRAQDLFEQAYGEQHPQTGYVLLHVGEALLALDRFDDAVEPLARAEERFGDPDPIPEFQAYARAALGLALVQSGGSRDRARSLYERAAPVLVDETYAPLDELRSRLGLLDPPG